MRFKERDQSSVRCYQRISLGVRVGRCRKESAWCSWWRSRGNRSRGWSRSSISSLPLLASSSLNTDRLESTPCATLRKGLSRNALSPPLRLLSRNMPNRRINFNSLTLYPSRLMPFPRSKAWPISTFTSSQWVFAFFHTSITDYFYNPFKFSKISSSL
jgi:hypothetical protein